MKKGKIYTQDQMQTIWKQFHYYPHSLLWSGDEGKTWNEVPSMDTGKWPLFSINDQGHRVEWIFKVKDHFFAHNN